MPAEAGGRERRRAGGFGCSSVRLSALIPGQLQAADPPRIPGSPGHPPTTTHTLPFLKRRTNTFLNATSPPPSLGHFCLVEGSIQLISCETH